MSEKELKRLIEKYYEGISTDEEEKTLRAYFSGNTVYPGFEAEKEIFSTYMDSSTIPEPSAGFEASIIQAIDNQMNQSRYVKIRSLLLPLMSAAAGLLILAGSYFFFIHRNEPDDTFTDPKIAYAETMKVLLEVSSQLNHGTRSLEPIGKINEMRVKGFKSINKSTVLIEKNLKTLGYLRNTNVETDTSKER
jgi:hypothetical protein